VLDAPLQATRQRDGRKPVHRDATLVHRLDPLSYRCRRRSILWTHGRLFNRVLALIQIGVPLARAGRRLHRVFLLGILAALKPA
jgi:hypothetical protein